MEEKPKEKIRQEVVESLRNESDSQLEKTIEQAKNSQKLNDPFMKAIIEEGTKMLEERKKDRDELVKSMEEESDAELKKTIEQAKKEINSTETTKELKKYLKRVVEVGKEILNKREEERKKEEEERNVKNYEKNMEQVFRKTYENHSEGALKEELKQAEEFCELYPTKQFYTIMKKVCLDLLAEKKILAEKKKNLITL